MRGKVYMYYGYSTNPEVVPNPYSTAAVYIIFWNILKFNRSIFSPLASVQTKVHNPLDQYYNYMHCLEVLYVTGSDL